MELFPFGRRILLEERSSIGRICCANDLGGDGDGVIGLGTADASRGVCCVVANVDESLAVLIHGL